MDIQDNRMTRRVSLQRTGALGLLAAVERLVPAWALTSAADAGSQTPLSGKRGAPL